MAAIYQSARPASFAEVVGQDHVKDILLAALRRGKASHAYLFSGPRGVGKTTTARLLAMALNCESEDVAAKPCGRCESCRMVREGRHPDVMELDAASNNSVDDVRELREKTSLAAMRGGFRVWVLDEAHMLSRAAANALLKTLEEPPPGLVFILATTEPEKLPATVLSRCQHFRFRRLSESEIRGKLERLCREAEVEAESDALSLVARAADGAMRDAESLLERLLTPGSTITRAAAEDALGLPPVHRMQRLAGAVAEGDLATLLDEAESLYRDGFAPRSLAENLGVILRDALRSEVLETEGASERVDGGEAFRLPLDRSSLLRLIHALDDEQDRFIRRDDLYSLEVALLKGVNALAEPLPIAQQGASAGADRVDQKPRPEQAAARAATRSAAQPAAQPGATRKPAGSTAGPSTAGPSTAGPYTAGSSTAGSAPSLNSTSGGRVPKDSAPKGPGAKEAPAGSAADELPSFDPTGRPPSQKSSPGQDDGAGRSRSTVDSRPTDRSASGKSPSDRSNVDSSINDSSNEEIAAADNGSTATPKRLDWHAVRSAAGPQLKAFLMPARETVDGADVTIRYGETHKFHFNELKKREGELARLIEEIGGPGYRLRIEGPGEHSAKKS